MSVSSRPRSLRGAGRGDAMGSRAGARLVQLSPMHVDASTIRASLTSLFTRLTSSMRAIVPFRIQQTWVAIEAGHVREVLGERGRIKIPSNAPQIPPSLASQGRAIALFDLGALGGALLPLQPGQRPPRTLVADVSGAILALPVDGVMEVEAVDDSRVQACHVTRFAGFSTVGELHVRPVPLFTT